MSTPTPGEIHVALEALRADAQGWREVAEEMRGAMREAEHAVIDSAAFTLSGGTVAAAYESLRAKLATLMTEAVDNFAAVAAALEASASDYEAEERAHVHRLRGIY